MIKALLSQMFCFTLLLSLLLTTGCSEKRPTYKLVIGNKEVILPIHDDPKLIQDDIISHLKPLWENMLGDASEVFHIERTTAWNFDGIEEMQEKAKARNADLSSSCTSSSAHIRFFKNRNGTSGIEECNERENPNDTKAICTFNEANTNWHSVEQMLCHLYFSRDDIRCNLRLNNSN